MARTESLSDTQNESVRLALRRLMDERMWTQRDVATALGVKQQSISGFLTGKTGTSRPVAERIANELRETAESVLASKAARLPVSATDSAAAARQQMSLQERDKKIEFINDGFCRAFKAGSSSLADLDAARTIITPLLLGLPSQDLESLDMMAMASVWLGVVVSQREAGIETTVASMILSVSKIVSAARVEPRL